MENTTLCDNINVQNNNISDKEFMLNFISIMKCRNYEKSNQKIIWTRIREV